MPSHPTSLDDEKSGVPISDEEMSVSAGSGEKSVLQAKLTNLAIQIGYAGEWHLDVAFEDHKFCC